MAARSRAEKFEEERRKISESCFSKKDVDGSRESRQSETASPSDPSRSPSFTDPAIVLESYITHIRIIEDAAYPSSPPPPESPPDNKKPRVIIVAVRKSGRVRMHKARENNNGTFSIGKTWGLEDLSTVQSFVSGVPRTAQDDQHMKWAGETGFIVTILKPYYWQAGTRKEKDFFLTNLVKIYRKYTDGKLPELLGFDAREKDALLGAGQRPRNATPLGNGEPVTSSPQSRFANSPPQPRPPSAPRPPSETRSPPPSQPEPISHPRTPSIEESKPPQLTPKSPSRGSWQRPSPERFRNPQLSNSAARDKLAEFARAATPDTAETTPSFSSQNERATTRSGSTEPTLLSPEPPPEPKVDEEAHRPGLGPMIKKKSTKDVAGAFRKAATAYNAFRPRAGGAADKLRDEKLSPTNEPDGITGVVPAPSLLRGTSSDTTRAPTPDRPMTPAAPVQPAPASIPEVKVNNTPLKAASETASKPVAKSVAKPDVVAPSSPEKTRPKTPNQETQRQQQGWNQILRELSALEIDPSLIEGTGSVNIVPVLNEFGWERNKSHRKSVGALEAELKRELGRVEAGSWLGHLEQRDERVDAVEQLLEKTIAECDELEGLLTLYSVELSTLNEDIQYIEAQSQGLQVQTANQKVLQSELQNLLQTISIAPKQLQALGDAPLDSSKGLEAAESALAVLYKAMTTIDPSLRRGQDSSNASTGDANYSASSGVNELGTMRALQEKKDGYRRESVTFMQRVKQFMDRRFQKIVSDASRAVEGDREGSLYRSSLKTKMDARKHEIIWNELWQFSPLMLFSREIEPESWEDMMRLYEKQIKVTYQKEFREDVTSWQKLARTPTGEEQELLFTHQEKDTEGITTTARKLTVKRSQTLAKTLRVEKADMTRSFMDRSQDGKMHAYEAFSGALDEISPAIVAEQDFIVDFFHVSSLKQMDFAEVVAGTRPELREASNFFRPKTYDPDRAMARRVMQLMDDIYAFWPVELQNLVDWAIAGDPLQGVGVLAAIARRINQLEETNHEFLAKTLNKVQDRLQTLFTRFVDEQVRAIEDTKVKAKKRRGVIAFTRIFPHFSTVIENMLPASSEQRSQASEVRDMIDHAYTRINKAMFESLQAIAKEGPGVRASGQGVRGLAQGDPEDKEALNYHILLIENMNHYIEEVDTRGNSVLEDWREKASAEMAKHLGQYISAVIRRPLGKLLDTLESTETLLLSTKPGAGPTEIATQASHSRSTFKKLLAAHDAKEIRRGIDTLKKRVEKHFGEGDDPVLSKELVGKVLSECERRYAEVEGRVRRVIGEVYEGGVEWDVSVGDIQGGFRR